MLTDLQSVINRITSDYQFRTGESPDANQVIEALIASYGGAAHAIYRYIDNRLTQLFPATADEDWLNAWANRVSLVRGADESLDDFRVRIEEALQARRRFGTEADLIFWGLTFNDVNFTYVKSNYPNFCETTIILGSDERLSDDRKSEIRNTIIMDMIAGSKLLVAQSPVQSIDFTIDVIAEHRATIQQTLDNLIQSTNANMNAAITIAQIHAKIDEITNDYTLISPVNRILADGDNHLTLGVITWQ